MGRPLITPGDRGTRALLEECFLQQGRISYLIRVLAFHPPHLSRFDATLRSVLRQTGPLRRGPSGILPPQFLVV